MPSGISEAMNVRQAVSTAIMNAANEVAVGAFLRREIGFLDIVRVVEKIVERLPANPVATIHDVIAVDLLAREETKRYLDEGE